MDKNTQQKENGNSPKKRYEKPRFKIIKPGDYPTNTTTISASTNRVVKPKSNG